MRPIAVVPVRPLRQPSRPSSRCFLPRRLAAAMASCSLLTLAPLATIAALATIASIATIATLAPSTALAQGPVLPTGLSVAAGQAQVATNGNRMTVTNSSQAILNWNSFSIGAGNAVYFQQPGASSQVLNRVTGNDPSLILGSLGSNGRVWLLNQNGVLFGQSARVDVAGLVASTLRLNDGDWLAGRYRFSDGGGSNGSASVLNQGEMRTSFGGSLALVAGSVGNEGLMQAPGGQVILAAGKSVELVDTGAAYVSVRIGAPAGEARNLGVLEAAGGRIDIHAAAVNQQGIVRADALASGPGGEVWIKASDSVTLAAGSRTSADGAANAGTRADGATHGSTGGGGANTGADRGNGGSVTVQSDGGRTTVQGGVSALGQHGSGGQVVLLGREVSVQDNARVDVSGSLGGGSVVVGGGERGQDLRYPNAQAVYFGPQASISADATQQGDGGHIVLWSDAATRAHGSLSARGGLLGGNGGHIETSGGWLDAQPVKVDTSAARGNAGQWLLDPYNIFISDGTSTSGFGAGPTFTASTSNSSISSATINAALVNANVAISTGGFNGGSEAGTITVSGANITSNVALPRSITFTADRAINITGSTIRSNQGALSVQMLSSQTSAGGISISGGAIVTGTGSTWGDIVFTGAASGQRPDGTTFTGAGGNVPFGVQVSNATLNAGLGSISLFGIANNAGGTAVALDSASLTSRVLTVTGDAPIGEGVRLSALTGVLATRTATVQGRGLATGVHLVDDAQLAVIPPTTDTSASLTIEGAARSATAGTGVMLATDASTSYGVLTARGASMVIRGTANGSTPDEAVHISAATSAGGPIVDASGGDIGGGNGLTIQTFGSGRNIVIDSGAVVVGGNGATSVQASGDITLTSNAVLSVRGTTALAATNINITAGAELTNDTSAVNALTLSAQANIALANASLFGGPTALSLLAGLGGAGTVTVTDSSIYSTAVSERPAAHRGSTAALNTGLQPNSTSTSGDIIIGGAVAGTTPTGGSFTGAGGAGGTGVVLTNSTLDAGNANVSIAGVATAGSGVGVNLNNSSVYGNSITITGDAPLGTGVLMQAGNYVAAEHDLAVKGRGLAAGVDLRDSAGVVVYPGALDATANGLLQGRALDAASGIGVRITTSGAGFAVELGNGASMTIEGASAASGTALLLSGPAGSNAPLIDASGGAGPFTLRTFDNGRQVQLTNVQVLGGSGAVTLQAASEVNFSNASLSSNGAIAVIADRVQLLGLGGITSQATGDAIVIAGSNAPLGFFRNTIGASALTAANSGGRWVVYATNPNDTANFNAGGLNYAFKRYNAAYGDWSLNSGNALVFSAPQTATYSGTVQNKVYDGGTTATLGNVSMVLSVAGDSALQQSSTVTFATPNAGTGIAASFVSPAPYTFRDGSNRPVYGYTLTGTLSGDITRKTVTGTVTVPDRVYDGTTAAVLNIGALSGLVGTQTLLASASGSFADKNVGSNKPIAVSYALANGSNGGLAGNYQFVGPITPSGNITQRQLAVSGVTVNDKVYNANTTATLAGTALVNALAGDTVTLATGSAGASFNNKNVGTAKPVTVFGYTLGGTDAANYSLVQPTGLTASISARPLGVSGFAAADKVYDASTAATLSGNAVYATLPGDNVVLAGLPVGVFADKNAGTGKTVTVTGFSLVGTDAANYSLVAPTATASITPRAVSLTGVSANNKVYDATTLATLAGTAAVTALSGDVVTVGGTAAASFANKNVGAGKAVTVTGYALGGADAGNYSLLQPTGLTASITPRSLALVGVSAADKVYDATTAATLVGTAGVAALAGDTVSVSGTGVATFNNKNVGTAKPVGVSGYTLAGADAGNYSLLTTNLSAAITPRAVAVTGLVASNKVYDATTAATLSGTAAVAALASDALTLGGTALASFADKNVGTGKSVTASGYTLAGADAANYSIVQPVGLTAAITPRAATITGLSANDKVYDATTVATLSGSGAVGTLAGDTVTLAGTPLARFSDKNVGSGKAVVVSGYSLAGADAGNYTAAQPTGLAAAITPRTLAISGVSAANKVYDATTAATLLGTAAVVPLAGDSVALAGTPSASFLTKDAGTAKPVAVTGYTFTGADAANYTAVAPGGLTATITPLALAVTGLVANNKVYDATTAATLSGSAGISALAGDSLALTGAPLATFDSKTVGSGKAVTVAGYTLAGADAGNYALRAPQGLTAAITPLQLLLTGQTVLPKVYDGTTAAALAGSAVPGALAGDAVALSGTGTATFDTKNVGNGKTVAVSGYTLAGADAGNYTLPASQLLSGAITPRPLAVTGVSAGGKVYDGSTAAALAGSAGVAAISGDTVQLAGTPVARFADRNVGIAKPVSVTGYAISGADAGNYSLAQPQGLSASITPAALTYVAEPAVRSVGQTITDLLGTVTGFVSGDTQANATTGALAFNTPATAGSPAGTYAVQGGGLTATNYNLGQAAGNAQALSIVDLTPSTTTVVASVAATEVASSIATILSAPRLGADSGVANLTASVAIGADAATKPVGDFKAVRLSSLSTADVQSLLAGRDLFKKALLADSVSKLQDNPRLADLRECQTVDDAQQGRCLITDKLKASAAQQQQATAVAAAPAAQPSGAPAPAAGTPGSSPATSPATPAVAPPVTSSAAQPSPASTAPAPLAAAQPPTRVPAPAANAAVDPLLREVQLIRRRVLAAALPQIDRKVALVIGVDTYADTSIPPLGNAVRDARSVAQLFETKLGYEAVVLDNATKATLVGALNRLALTLGPRDSVVIYYAGHGELVESTNLGYWLLSDSSAKDPESWLSNTDISRLIGQIGASQVALISDSCYSGSLASEERIRAAPATLDPKAVLAHKSVVIMSSGGNEPVFDEGRDGHSPFAWNLMNTLNKVADWQAGGNVFERVRFAVARELPQRPQYSASRAAGHQAGGDYLFEQRELAGNK